MTKNRRRNLSIDSKLNAAANGNPCASLIFSLSCKCAWTLCVCASVHVYLCFFFGINLIWFVLFYFILSLIIIIVIVIVISFYWSPRFKASNYYSCWFNFFLLFSPRMILFFSFDNFWILKHQRDYLRVTKWESLNKSKWLYSFARHIQSSCRTNSQKHIYKKAFEII